MKNLLHHFFGKKDKKQNDQDILKMETAKNIESRMHSHLKGVRQAIRNSPYASELTHLCNQLFKDELLSFSLRVIQDSLHDVLLSRSISSSAKTFSEWFVAITTCYGRSADDVRMHLPFGYMSFLSELTKPAYTYPDARNVAHWIYFSDGSLAGVDLTLVPNPKKIQRGASIIAEDLLTFQERRELGL